MAGPGTSSATAIRRRLYCGNNLEVLREQPAGSVDWVYLDPPFNSGRNWNMKPASGSREEVLAFRDTWRWSAGAAQQYKDCTASDTPLGAMLTYFRSIYGESGTLAYLLHMTARLTELHRVLAETGGIFLHCDPTMSHYLQILLDVVFGAENFAAEIVWKRTSAHSNATRNLARIHDVIFAYQRSRHAAWTGPDGLIMQRLGDNGTVWTDIPPLNATARERLGYPTQKPLPLLNRIITLASRAGGTLLDPYCGCGTSIDAAHQLGLGWIGIDLSPLAIALTQSRLQAHGADFETHGAPPATPPAGTLF